MAHTTVATPGAAHIGDDLTEPYCTTLMFNLPIRSIYGTHLSILVAGYAPLKFWKNIRIVFLMSIHRKLGPEPLSLCHVADDGAGGCSQLVLKNYPICL